MRSLYPRVSRIILNELSGPWLPLPTRLADEFDGDSGAAAFDGGRPGGVGGEGGAALGAGQRQAGAVAEEEAARPGQRAEIEAVPDQFVRPGHDVQVQAAEHAAHRA